MEKAYTYRDFLTECENYNHSKEHYEIMKESAELMLMEQFVENQEFAKENTIEFTEGYLMEAADTDSVNAVSEAIDKKGQGLVKKIFSKIATLFKRFAAWIKKLFTKIASKFKKKTVTLTDDEKAKYGTEIIAIVRKWADDGIYILDKKDNAIVPSDEDGVIGYILNALKSGKMYVKSAGNAVSYETIVHVCCEVTGNQSVELFNKYNNQLKNEIGKVIEVDLNSIIDQKTVDMAIAEIKDELADIKADYAYNKIIKAMEEFLETLNVVIPATSKFYAEIVDGISKIEGIVDKLEADRAAANKGDN